LLLWGCWTIAKLILPLEEATPSLCLQPVPLVAHGETSFFRNLVEHQAAPQVLKPLGTIQRLGFWTFAGLGQGSNV
jgi:hypothetical protein